jgi:Cap4 SAVED domain
LPRFPIDPSTRKGNLAEVVLAEYLVAATGIVLPIYRLRYNPNIDQSMKGDDVLAFDLDSNPVRIIVGEAKFRGTSTKKAVEEIVDGLARSTKQGSRPRSSSSLIVSSKPAMLRWVSVCSRARSCSLAETSASTT